MTAQNHVAHQYAKFNILQIFSTITVIFDKEFLIQRSLSHNRLVFRVAAYFILILFTLVMTRIHVALIKYPLTQYL